MGLAAAVIAAPAAAAEITDLGPVAFTGEIREPLDLSGAAVMGDRLLIGSDEGSVVQVLRPAAAGGYEVQGCIPLLADDRAEVDIEAIAVSERRVFVAGSHSHVRRRVEFPGDPDGRKYERNRERLATVEPEPTRDRVFRFLLSPAGELSSSIEAVDLRPLLAADPVLGPFTTIPGKEGGVDIEGLAAAGDLLHVGFRGPVLRENWVPVLRFDFGRPDAYELVFVNLGGHGIRDLLRVSGGFLILAGPVGDGAGAPAVYFWDGVDCVPGRDRTPGRLVGLGPLPASGAGKAEALALLAEDADAWTVLVLHDGVAGGGARRLRIPRP